MGTSIGQINLDLGINSSGFKSQLKGIKNSTGGLTKSFGKLGIAVAAAFSIKAIVSFGKECLKLGSDLNEVQNVVDVTFGSMSAKVNEFAKNAMTAFGMSEAVAKKYMGQFGAMSKAFGNTEQAAYAQAEALTGLAGDVASFYNMSTDEAFTKLKSVYTGETESLKELGVVMTQAALDSFALQQGLGKTTKDMSEQEKVALRLSFVQSRLADASGDFARTSGGWANQTRVLALRFDALKASIGQGLINVLTPVIRLLNVLLERLQKAADAFKNFTVWLMGDAGSSGVNSAAISSEALADNMDNTASSAKALKKSLAGFDKINVLSSSSDSGTSGETSGGTSGGTGLGITSSEATATAGAVGALVGILDQVKTKLIEIANVTGLSGLWTDFLIGVDNVKIGVSNIFSALTGAIQASMPNIQLFAQTFADTFLTILQTITGIWGDMWTTLTANFLQWTTENQASLQAFFQSIITTFANLGTLISTIVGDMFTDIGNWWATSGQPIFDGFCKAIMDVWTWILDLYNIVIAPVVEKIIQILNDLWQNTFRPLWNNLLGLITDIGELFLALWNNILKPVVDWIIANFGPPISKLFQGLAEVVGIVVGTIGKILSGLVTSLRGVIQFLTGVFTGDWSKAWGGLKMVVQGAWDALVAGAKGAWDGIKKVFGGLASFFVTIFREAWNGVKKVFSVGGKIFDGIKDGIVTAFKTVVNAIITGINKVVATPFEGLNKILKKINGIEIAGIKPFKWLTWRAPVPKIPLLANGGYVDANTPQLAVIGDNKREGEIVAPESKIAEAVARGFAAVMSKLQGQSSPQNDRPIYLTLKLGEDDFWEGFVNYHNSIVKRTGDSPLLV
jgi:phage-related protein